MDASASARAINPPVMLSVRVPPSASSTSQSMVIVRGPRASKSTTARKLRPISRWISVVRPSTLFRSRRLRGEVLPGSMLYSAVAQPVGFSMWAFQGGTLSSTLAVQRIVVRPAWINTLPGVALCKPALDGNRPKFQRLSVVVTHEFQVSGLSVSSCGEPSRVSGRVFPIKKKRSSQKKPETGRKSPGLWLQDNKLEEFRSSR